MFKLIDKGTDFSKFADSDYDRFPNILYDFPVGLVLISDSDKNLGVSNWFLIIGDEPSGNRTNGSECCSSDYDLEWLRRNRYNRWELYEYQPQTKD